MATIPITIPDPIVARANNLLGRKWGYRDEVPDPADPETLIPNPESKGDFNKRKIVEWVKSEAVAQEVHEAGQTAQATQQATSETELDIT